MSWLRSYPNIEVELEKDLVLVPGAEVKVLQETQDGLWVKVDANLPEAGWIKKHHLAPLPLPETAHQWRVAPSAIVVRPPPPPKSWTLVGNDAGIGGPGEGGVRG